MKPRRMLSQVDNKEKKERDRERERKREKEREKEKRREETVDGQRTGSRGRGIDRIDGI